MSLRENLYALRVRLFERRHAYRTIFNGPLGKEVLRDLAKFCRAHDSAFHPDARAHAVMEGRREVFLRIARHMNLGEEQLWQLYDGRDVPS